MMKMNVDRDKFDRERERGREKKKLHQLLYMRSNWGLFVIWQNLCIIGGKMRVSQVCEEARRFCGIRSIMGRTKEAIVGNDCR